MGIKSVFVFLFLISGYWGLAQNKNDNGYIVVRDIEVEGNRKTKKHIVLRELDFSVGDTLDIASLQERFARNSKWFVNTDLFSSTKFNLEDWNFETHEATIKLTVFESWYIYPVPLIELADENFNVWWADHNHTLDRINLGLAYYQNNFSGRHDKLTILAQVGFTQKAEIAYNMPFLNKKGTVGVKTKLSFIRQKSIGYQVVDFKEIFNEVGDDFMLRRSRITMDWAFRPNVRLTHTLLTGYHHNSINTTVADSLNDQYFGKGLTDERYLSLGYQLRLDKRDINLYPMSGHLVEFETRYDGSFAKAGPDQVVSSLLFAQYFTLSKRWSTEFVGKGMKNLYCENPSYYHNTSLSGDDYIRGYEYYLLKGQDYGYVKASVRFLSVERPIPVSKVGLKDIPFRLFLTFNNDVGMIKDKYFPEQNKLSEVWLWGRGIGLDFVFYENKAIQVEYSLNHFQEKGLFLHLKLFN